MSPRRLPQSFYARDVREVARALLGKQLRRGPVRLRITEVEAYCGPEDSACHTSVGRTDRNAPMWGPAGRAYVYLCYGLHVMLNIVTGRREGKAVLIRACEPQAGLELVRSRRGGKEGPVLLTGPGKVGAALDLDTGFSHHPLYLSGGLQLFDGPPPDAVLAGPRIGIDYARRADRAAPLRYAVADTPWITHPNGLKPPRR